MTTEQQYLLLAGATVECGPEHGKGKYALPAPKWCSKCKEGRVPLIEGLRAMCRHDASFAYACSCDGRGWTPKQGPEAVVVLLEWIASQHFVVTIWPPNGLPLWSVSVSYFSGKGDTLEEAVCHTITKIIQRMAARGECKLMEVANAS